MPSVAPIRFRRMMDCRYDGTCGPRVPMTYHVLVWGRENRRIMGVLVAPTRAAGFQLVRALMARYPTRMVSISRTIHSGIRRVDASQPIFAVPDYRSFRALTPYHRERRGRWTKVRGRSDVLTALRSPERIASNAGPVSAQEGMRT